MILFTARKEARREKSEAVKSRIAWNHSKSSRNEASLREPVRPNRVYLGPGRAVTSASLIHLGRLTWP